MCRLVDDCAVDLVAADLLRLARHAFRLCLARQSREHFRGMLPGQRLVFVARARHLLGIDRKEMEWFGNGKDGHFCAGLPREGYACIDRDCCQGRTVGGYKNIAKHGILLLQVSFKPTAISGLFLDPDQRSGLQQGGNEFA
ncbi:hypothetical protein D9M72_578740 [compost metagenome]